MNVFENCFLLNVIHIIPILIQNSIFSSKYILGCGSSIYLKMNNNFCQMYISHFIYISSFSRHRNQLRPRLSLIPKMYITSFTWLHIYSSKTLKCFLEPLCIASHEFRISYDSCVRYCLKWKKFTEYFPVNKNLLNIYR